ncbi:FadR family transcriptional regulator, partial [bacterium M00.F.Ca.ET.141.01.1.1]
IKAGDAKGASAAMTRHLAGAASRVGLPGGEASAKPASPARHSRLRKAVRGQAAG